MSTVELQAIESRLDTYLQRHRAEIIGVRHHLHQNPELSWQEKETTAYLVEYLERRGITTRVLPRGVGLVCDIGESAGRRVALRADIDALALDDPKDVPYASLRPGVCHACGHDVHTTTVVGAGLALSSIVADDPRALGDRGVRLIFQPAEEDVPSGAPMVIASGGLEDVGEIYALHCDPRRPVGTVGVRDGPISAAADAVHIRLTGPGGHTARPQLTVDLVGLAAKVVTDLTFGVSRLTDSRGGANLTFGSVYAGTTANVIPTEAILKASLRALDRATWEAAPDLVASLLESSVRPYGADYELDYRQGAPPVVNSPAQTDVVRAVARRQLGAEHVAEVEQSVGGEDFSWYLERVPGSYLRLGVRDVGDDAPDDTHIHDLHDGSFDVAEESIIIGARLLAGVAIEAAYA